MNKELIKAKLLVAEKFGFTDWAHLCRTFASRGKIVPNQMVEEAMLMYHKLAYAKKQEKKRIDPYSWQNNAYGN